MPAESALHTCLFFYLFILFAYYFAAFCLHPMGSPPILRQQTRPGLKETAEIISVLYSDHDSDLLYGQGGGFQKLFCIFYLQPQNIFSRGAADIFAKEPNQMRLADAGKVREVIQGKMLMIIILYISQQIDQIFRYSADRFFVKRSGGQKQGQKRINFLRNQQFTIGRQSGIQFYQIFQLCLEISVSRLMKFQIVIFRKKLKELVRQITVKMQIRMRPVGSPGFIVMRLSAVNQEAFALFQSIGFLFIF